MRIVKIQKIIFKIDENYFHIYDFSIKSLVCQQILEIFLKILVNFNRVKIFKIF